MRVNAASILDDRRLDGAGRIQQVGSHQDELYRRAIESYASDALSGTAEAVETERLWLVPWSDSHLDDFARIRADVDVMRFISGGRPFSRTEVEVIHGRARSAWKEYGFGPWAAIDKHSGLWIGRIGLNLLADWPGEDRWEVGYELDRRFWGRGYATEGAQRAIRFGWDQTPLKRIISVTRPDNLASRHVMEKCGLTFQAETRLRGATVVWYAIDRPY